MIFVSGKDGSMFLMLSEADIEIMRQGNTKFVDERQTGGVTFNKVVLSLHKTDEEAVKILRSAGHFVPNPEKLPKVEPKGEETRCKGCNCITQVVLEGRCIVCWHTLALGRQPIQDGQHKHGQ